MVYTMKAMIYDQLDNLPEMLNFSNMAININPNNFMSLSCKASALQGMNRFSEAIEWYDKALQFNLGGAEIWVNKGLCYYGIHQYEKSIECCDESLRLDPSGNLARQVKRDATIKLRRFR